MQGTNVSRLLSPTSESIRTEAVPIVSDSIAVSAIPLTVLIVFTIFGNLLVCAAFYLCRDLRTVTNYFVVSLAIADLLVGFVCMPFWFSYLIQQRPNSKQDFELYTLWICLDIVSGTSSIMNLVAISVDRFYAITSPFNYHLKLTKKRALFCIVLLWLYSIAVASLHILKNRKWYGYFVSCASFFLPLPVLVYSYARIFRVAHEQALKMRGDRRGHVMSEVGHDEKNGEAVETDVFVNTKPRATYSMASRNSYSATLRQPSNASRFIFHKVRPRLTSQSSVRQMRRVLHTDLKAAKTLAIVMGAFIACWSPYIITMLIAVACGAHCLPWQVIKIMKWLHYSNSAVNPIIYTLLNRHFRAAFRRILCRFVSARRFSYVGRLLSHSTPRSSARSSAGNTVADLCKTQSKSEIEILVCTEVVTVV